MATMIRSTSLLLVTLVLGSSVQAQSLFTETSGTPPGREMKKTKTGVPTFPITKKTKSIPLLKIGEVGRVKITQPESLKYQKVTPYPFTKFDWGERPKVFDTRPLLKKTFQRANKTLEFVKINPNFKAPAVAPLKEIADAQIKNAEVDVREIKKIGPHEEKLIQASILYEIHKSYNLAILLFNELMNESKEYKQIATLFYAKSAGYIQLPSERRAYLLKLAKEGTAVYQKLALAELVENAAEGDTELVGLIDEKVNELNINTNQAHQFQINRAKYFLEKKDISNALAAIEEVPLTSKLYGDAGLLKGIIYYRIGKHQDAILTLTKTLELLEKEAPTSELKSVTALTLARTQFQVRQYRAAFESFLKVNKNNPLWPQAMMEQAWAQILMEDYEGAAGNMYSLHTDFFKNTFAPESYIVRAVGYLNLCQFGDGNKAVYSLYQRYQPMKDMLEQYQSKANSEDGYYETVRNFFQNPKAKVVDGLHRNFVYEIARHPSFIFAQSAVNQREDQIGKLTHIQNDLGEVEKVLIQKQSAHDANIAKLKKTNEKANQEGIRELQRKITSLKIQQSIAKRGKDTIQPTRKIGIDRLAGEKNHFKRKAAVALKKRFEEIQVTLSKTLESAELLNYELHAGAGEHLRHQHAGGAVNDKERDQLKVKDGKALKWDFKGEVWEDELGHFRSSLKNVCPKSESVSQN